MGAVLGHAQQSFVGEEEVHLRWRFGVGSVLEDDPDAVDVEFVTGLVDGLGRSDEPGCADRGGLAESSVDLALRPECQQRPELVQRTARHDRPGEHVLADGLLHEPLGGDHPHVAGIDRPAGGDAEHPTEVVDVAVGVDHCGDGTFAERVVGEFETRAGGLLAREGVDDQPAVVGGDERDVAEVVTACLPDAVGHLEQAVDGVEATLPPQAGVHGVRCRLVGAEEVVVGDIPDRAAPTLEAAGRMLGDQPV